MSAIPPSFTGIFPLLMSLRKRKHKRISRKNQQNGLGSGLPMGILVVLVFGFLISGIDRIFFNSGINIEYPDLSILLTKTTYEKKTGHKIQMEIRNGCGIPKLARMYTNFLRSEGIDVLDSKNAENFNYTKTKILHHRGELERALVLANIIMVDESRIIEDKNETLFYDLTLIIGKDYIDLPSYRNAVLYQQPY